MNLRFHFYHTRVIFKHSFSVSKVGHMTDVMKYDIL